jgi:glutathione peroxidase
MGTGQTLYDISAALSDGRQLALADYRGKVLLIVNTASKCGFTPQYEGLQELYTKLKESGLEILAFPCDQFAHQEPGSDPEIQAFCQTRFGVTFPVFQKVEVNGANAHPLFKLLKDRAPGWLGRSIKWNFTKFLVDREGRVVKRFAPKTAPAKIEPRLRELLGL